MNDYFDHVERSLREAVRERRHLPWYGRMLSHRSRPALVVVIALLGGGTALAATGVLQTGAPVSSEVKATPYAYEGTVIASSVRVLPAARTRPRGRPSVGPAGCEDLPGAAVCRAGPRRRRADRGARAGWGLPRRRRVPPVRRELPPRASGAAPRTVAETPSPTSSCTASPPAARSTTAATPPAVATAAPPRPRPARRASCATCTSACSGRTRRTSPRWMPREARPSRRPPRPVAPTWSCCPTGNRPAARKPSSARAAVATTTTPSPPPSPSTKHHCRQLPKRAPCRLPDAAEQLQQERASQVRVRETLRTEHPDIYAKLYRDGRLRQRAVATLSPHQIAELQAVRGPIREPSCPDVGFVAPSGARTQLTAAELASPVTAHTAAGEALLRTRRGPEHRPVRPHRAPRLQAAGDGGSTRGAADRHLHRPARRSPISTVTTRSKPRSRSIRDTPDSRKGAGEPSGRRRRTCAPGSSSTTRAS